MHNNFRSKTEFTYLNKTSLFSVGLSSFLVDDLYVGLSRYQERVFWEEKHQTIIQNSYMIAVDLSESFIAIIPLS